MAAEVVVFGHSFIRRLERYSNGPNGWLNLGFDQSDLNLRFLGMSGGTLRRGRKCILSAPFLRKLDSYHPRVVFIQAGGNDLSSKDCCPYELARDLVSAAEYLITGHGVRHVIIGQLLRRFSARCPPDYNVKVVEVNDHAKRMVARSSACNNISFWHHRGFWRDTGVLLDADGTHPNSTGMRKYARSVRAAIGVTRKQGVF